MSRPSTGPFAGTGACFPPDCWPGPQQAPYSVMMQGGTVGGPMYYVQEMSGAPVQLPPGLMMPLMQQPTTVLPPGVSVPQFAQMPPSYSTQFSQMPPPYSSQFAQMPPPYSSQFAQMPPPYSTQFAQMPPLYSPQYQQWKQQQAEWLQGQLTEAQEMERMILVQEQRVKRLEQQLHTGVLLQKEHNDLLRQNISLSLLQQRLAMQQGGRDPAATQPIVASQQKGQRQQQPGQGSQG